MTRQGEIGDIDLANLMANLAQLDMMQRQMRHDRDEHDSYHSTIVALLTEIRDELRRQNGGD